MDPYQTYRNYSQNQSPPVENSSNQQNPPQPPFYFHSQPPSTGENSHNPQYPMYPPPSQFYSQNPNQFMYPRPPNSYMSQIGSSNARVPETQFEPNFSTQGSLENIVLEEEEEEATHSKGKRSAWSDAEDLLLVQSWVNISTDPIQGNDQKSTTFWEKITSNYNKYREASYM
jgi:hypothetical protein